MQFWLRVTPGVTEPRFLSPTMFLPPRQELSHLRQFRWLGVINRTAIFSPICASTSSSLCRESFLHATNRGVPASITNRHTALSGVKAISDLMTTITPTRETTFFLRPEGIADEEFLLTLYAQERAAELEIFGLDALQRKLFVQMQFRA